MVLMHPGLQVLEETCVESQALIVLDPDVKREMSEGVQIKPLIVLSDVSAAALDTEVLVPDTVTDRAWHRDPQRGSGVWQVSGADGSATASFLYALLPAKEFGAAAAEACLGVGWTCACLWTRLSAGKRMSREGLLEARPCSNMLCRQA